MSEYRLFHLNERSTIAATERLAFPDDVAAVRFLRSRPVRHAVELWHGQRFVTRREQSSARAVDRCGN